MDKKEKSLYDRQRYQENRDEMLERARVQYRDNPELRQKRKLYYEKNKERDSEKLRQKNKDLRLEIIKVLGGECVRCGFCDDWRAFQIDHINGGGTKELTSTTTACYYKKVTTSFLSGEKKYQLLCANCNQIKRYEKREF